MGPREIASREDLGDVARRRVKGGAAAAAMAAWVTALMMTPGITGATTLTVTSGNVDQGQFCPGAALCPGTPLYSLLGAAPVTGSFTYNPGATPTVDFTLQLTGPANFGPFQLLAGSVLQAVAVPVIVSALGGGIEVDQSGPATALVNVLNTSLGAFPEAPSVSGLTCSIGTGFDQCGVSFGAVGLTLPDPFTAAPINGFLTVNADVVPVPPAAWLFASGLGLLGAVRRRVSRSG